MPIYSVREKERQNNGNILHRYIITNELFFILLFNVSINFETKQSKTKKRKRELLYFIIIVVGGKALEVEVIAFFVSISVTAVSVSI